MYFAFIAREGEGGDRERERELERLTLFDGGGEVDRERERSLRSALRAGTLFREPLLDLLSLGRRSL